MPKVIQRFDARFVGINVPITLSIPRGSEEVAIRVYRAEQTLSIFALAEIGSGAPTYERTFMLILDDQPVPDNYLKYVATVPFGPGLIQTHIVEVG